MIKRLAAKETALRGLFLFTLLIFTPLAPLLVFLDSSRVNRGFCRVIVSRLNRNRQTGKEAGIKTAVRRIKLKKRWRKKVLGRTELSSPRGKQPTPSTQHFPRSIPLVAVLFVLKVKQVWSSWRGWSKLALLVWETWARRLITDTHPRQLLPTQIWNTKQSP